MKYLLQCESVFDEAARIANRICGLIADGARYKDIVVVICDYDDTVAIYNETFSHAGIPVNVDVGMKLIDHPFTKYLRDVIAGNPWVEKKVIKGKTVKKICAELLVLLEKCNDENAKIKITEILETCTNILGNQSMTLNEFNNMFCTLASAAKISSVPTYADRVLLVSAKEYEPAFIPYLFVAGAGAGVFPPVAPDTDIITEQDIANVTFRIEPSASLQAARARRHAKNILASATRELCASYSATNVKGERVGASELITNYELQITNYKELNNKVYARQQVLTAIGNKTVFQNDMAKYWSSVQSATDLRGMPIPQLGVKPNNITCGTELFFPGNKARVTQIENFVKCPYYHFLINGLGVKKRDPDGKIGAHVIGTILHEYAEQFVKCKMQNTECKIEDILKKYSLPRYAVAAVKRQTKAIAKFLTEDIEKSDYKPHYLEHKLEKQIEGVAVRGVADRIDIAVKNGRKHAIVVDYKSGGAGGVRMQLPLYMDFLRDKYIPDGAYYLNLKDFKKRHVSPNEIDSVMEQTSAVIKDTKNGIIDQNPYKKDVCEYCPAGAMCT